MTKINANSDNQLVQLANFAATDKGPKVNGANPQNLVFNTKSAEKSMIGLELERQPMVHSYDRLDIEETKSVVIQETQAVEKPNFNRKIEPTKQGNQGDCWLLSVINSLKDSDWGRKAAIVSDEDGNGVTVKFPDAPLEEKEFHITAEEIAQAKQSGHYSSGDNDVIARELATEKVIRKMADTGLGKE